MRNREAAAALAGAFLLTYGLMWVHPGYGIALLGLALWLWGSNGA